MGDTNPEPLDAWRMLIAQGTTGPWTDDPAIGSNEELVRFVIAADHIVPDGDGYAVSFKAFMGKPSLSVELVPLIQRAGSNLATRAIHHKAAGHCILHAGAVRRVPTTYKGNGEPDGAECYKICYTPEQVNRRTNETFRNEFHCDIFPRINKPGAERLMDVASITVDGDSARALLLAAGYQPEQLPPEK